MKSLEERISLRKTSLKEAGVSDEQITEAVKDCTSMEQKLNVLEAFNANPFTRHNRVMRKNGSAIHESDSSNDQVLAYMKRTGASFRESTLILTGTDIGPNGKPSSELIEALKNKWREYCSVLTEEEVSTLANKLIEP